MSSAVAVMWLFSTLVKLVFSYALDTSPKDASCAQALAFGGAKLPEGAYDEHCTVEAWLDTSYDATFRMPRDGVRDWLKATYPHAPEPHSEYCDDGADVCLDLTGGGHDAPPAGADANAVEVDVTYEGHGRALVRFTAYTV
ncbi:hypothetical protein AB0N17_15325 [Streptomyces sp. NPDC051133]|uniref:hypothetical protein n=1 Tax=Streptomyces sp. NPDC051133 TaxID=3155521 RepID=UPI00343DD256